jgi:hypothetical protein
MNEEDLIEMLQEAIINHSLSNDMPNEVEVRAFEGEYVICGNPGLVLKFSDGAKYQLQIIRVN